MKRKKSLTGFHVATMNKSANRVVVTTDSDEVADYLREHEVYVETSKGNKTRMGSHGFNVKNRSNPKYDQTILEIDRIPAFARQLRRIVDQLEGGRTIGSLATESQLNRIKQYYEILSRRIDNTLFPPVELDMFTHGEIGRLHSDLETILVKEGLWYSELKRETEKAAQLKRVGLK